MKLEFNKKVEAILSEQSSICSIMQDSDDAFHMALAQALEAGNLQEQVRLIVAFDYVFMHYLELLKTPEGEE